MQIEQNFRDIKNQELGLGLRQNQSQTIDRITMLWLLACLIIIISWWIGLMVETTNQHWSYQANTVKISELDPLSILLAWSIDMSLIW